MDWQGISMRVIVTDSSKFFSASEEESFNRMVTTPLGSRAVRPFFGSEFHELVDKTMDQEWMLKCQRYGLECFLDENNEPWDPRFVPLKTRIDSIDETAGVVGLSIKFEDREVSINMGGFR